ELWVSGNHAAHVAQEGSRDASVGERIGPRLGVLLARERCERRVELVVPRAPSGDSVELPVGGPAERAAGIGEGREGAPLVVRLDGDRNPLAIAGGIGALRCGGGSAVALPTHPLPLAAP